VVGTNPAPSLSESEARDTLSAFGALLYALGFSLFTEQSAKTETPDAIRSLAEERWEAKQAKDFARADSLRETLLQEGWLVKDSPNGYQIEPNPAP
jgi:cysteinyl-tRNA synthetase